MSPENASLILQHLRFARQLLDELDSESGFRRLSLLNATALQVNAALSRLLESEGQNSDVLLFAAKPMMSDYSALLAELRRLVDESSTWLEFWLTALSSMALSRSAWDKKQDRYSEPEHEPGQASEAVTGLIASTASQIPELVIKQKLHWSVATNDQYSSALEQAYQFVQSHIALQSEY